MKVVSACMYIHKLLAVTETEMYCNVFSLHILNWFNINSALHQFLEPAYVALNIIFV